MNEKSVLMHQRSQVNDSTFNGYQITTADRV